MYLGFVVLLICDNKNLEKFPQKANKISENLHQEKEKLKYSDFFFVGKKTMVKKKHLLYQVDVLINGRIP
jgi:hypothetical protein